MEAIICRVYNFLIKISWTKNKVVFVHACVASFLCNSAVSFLFYTTMHLFAVWDSFVLNSQAGYTSLLHKNLNSFKKFQLVGNMGARIDRIYIWTLYRSKLGWKATINRNGLWNKRIFQLRYLVNSTLDVNHITCS